jgi:hypothetical protein
MYTLLTIHNDTRETSLTAKIMLSMFTRRNDVDLENTPLEPLPIQGPCVRSGAYHQILARFDHDDHRRFRTYQIRIISPPPQSHRSEPEDPPSDASCFVYINPE